MDRNDIRQIRSSKHSRYWPSQKNQTMKKYSKLIVLLLVCIPWCLSSSLAEENSVELVLFTGKVSLLNRTKQRFPAQIGKEILIGKYPWIALDRKSSLFLRKGDKLIKIESAGVYSLYDLTGQPSSTIAGTLSFLKQLGRPSRLLTQSRARGEPELHKMTEAEYFEYLWERIVLEASGKAARRRPEELLATAAWYQQRNKPARVAFILERLNTVTENRSGFYRQMRIESLRGITLVRINQEVADTRRKIEQKGVSMRYRALLIGIDRYDNPVWQRLKNPIRDVRALKKLLISDFSFNREDVLLLENATHDRIIAAFQQLKKTTDKDTSLLVYFAGHGFYPPDEEEGYWIPGDAGSPDTQRLFLPTSTILSKIKSIKSKHTLLIADSCFSGSLIRKSRSIEVNSQFYQELSRKKSRQIITSGGLEPVSDQGGGNHSIFAGKLIRILSAQSREPLSASELALNLRKEVKNAWGDQTPEYGRLHIADDESGEFFFIRKNQSSVYAAARPEKQEAIRQPMPTVKTYSYRRLPKGNCMFPQPFHNLKHCRFNNMSLKDADFEGANLKNVRFQNSTIVNVVFKGANLDRANFSHSTIRRSDFEQAVLKRANFSHSSAEDLSFVGANLQRSKFTHSSFAHINFDEADLSRANMRNSTFSDISMKNAITMNTEMPSGWTLGQKDPPLADTHSQSTATLPKADATPTAEFSSTSVDLRRDSILFIGITPVGISVPVNLTRPFSVGFYLGQDKQFGLEYGYSNFNESGTIVSSTASLDISGIYMRHFTGNSFNLLFGVRQRTWTAEATVKKWQASSNSYRTTAVVRTDSMQMIRFGIGNQWVTDSGITLGGDWGIVTTRIGNISSEYTIREDGGFGMAEIDAAMDHQAEKSSRDAFLSEGDDFLTGGGLFFANFTIGWTF